MRRSCLAALAALLMFTVPAPTSAFYYDLDLGYLPECEEPKVLARIIYYFNHATTRLLHDGAQINAIDQPAEHGFVAYGPKPILRRYCRGRAWLGPDYFEPVHYLIEKGMGFAGTGWKVEYCVVNFDEWRVYGGNCRVLRRHKTIID
jgi:hypothetical protein